MNHVRFPRIFPVLGLAAALILAVALGPVARARVNAQNPPPPPPPSVPGPTPAPSVAPANGEPAPAPTVPLAIPTELPASPSPTPSPEGRRHRGRHESPAGSASPTPEPSATPTSPAFATLDGTWEMQLQFIDHTEYSYLVIAQKEGGVITGVWRVNKHEWPFEGTYDGRLIRMLVKEGDDSVTLSGYVEGASDMVGTVDTGAAKGSPTAFTAEHRASNRSNPFSKKKG